MVSTVLWSENVWGSTGNTGSEPLWERTRPTARTPGGGGACGLVSVLTRSFCSDTVLSGEFEVGPYRAVQAQTRESRARRRVMAARSARASGRICLKKINLTYDQLPVAAVTRPQTCLEQQRLSSVLGARRRPHPAPCGKTWFSAPSASRWLLALLL